MLLTAGELCKTLDDAETIMILFEVLSGDRLTKGKPVCIIYLNL